MNPEAIEAARQARATLDAHRTGEVMTELAQAAYLMQRLLGLCAADVPDDLARECGEWLKRHGRGMPERER